jgi:hypothetical protein
MDGGAFFKAALSALFFFSFKLWALGMDMEFFFSLGRFDWWLTCFLSHAYDGGWVGWWWHA